MFNIRDFFKSHRPLMFFLVVLFLISPGIIYLFLWHQDLFITLDWVKLVILSLSVLAPVALMNTFILIAIEKIEPSKTGVELVNAFTITSIFSGFFCLLGLFSAYSNGHLYLNLVAAELFLVLLMWNDSRKQKLTDQSKSSGKIS